LGIPFEDFFLFVKRLRVLWLVMPWRIGKEFTRSLPRYDVRHHAASCARKDDHRNQEKGLSHGGEMIPLAAEARKSDFDTRLMVVPTKQETTMLDEPAPPTLGTIRHFGKLAAMAEGKTGLDYVVAKLRELNFRYCWTPGLRNKPQTDWSQVNRHLWRIQALYFGGDCFLARWPGASPHQRLSGYRQPKAREWEASDQTPA